MGTSPIVSHPLAAMCHAVNVVRTVVAGIFTYMAVFELSPPHTHNRAANAGYLLFFVAGTAIAYLADLAEQLSARPPPT